MDLGIGYKIPWENNLEVAANNLFVTHYRDHLNWGGIPNMGRNIILKMTFAH